MVISNNCKLINASTGDVQVPVDISPFEFSEERKQQIDNMRQDYRNAFISLGFDVENKDILEVLTFLVNELNKTKAELESLKSYARDKFYKLLW